MQRNIIVIEKYFTLENICWHFRTLQNFIIPEVFSAKRKSQLKLVTVQQS